MNPATLRRTAVLALALAAPLAAAQSLGDEFILFVNGTNVMIPSTDAVPVNDPLDETSGNKVAKFNNGSWTSSGWFWSRTEGVDATASVGATYGESDTLYFRLLSDPKNKGQSGVSIMLSDATDDSGANDGSADLEFRLLWTIPDELHDGVWHDLAIPLPPATYAALKEADANGELQSGAEHWTYPGAWSSGNFGVGPGFGGSTDDPLWKEFDWAHLYKIGPFWDNDQGGDNPASAGPIWMDNVYIGGPSTDISSASDAPSAMSGVSFTTDGAVNVVDWPDNAAFGGYKVYASLDPISDVSADGVVLLKSIGFDDDSELRHRYEIPHPSMGAEPIYYAVTSLSAFGVENPDVAQSSGSITNAQLPQKPYIRELNEANVDAAFTAVGSGTVTDSFFPAGHPVFHLDSSHRSPGDGTSETTLPTDTDNSGMFKIGYSSDGYLIVYGEITDDQVTFAGEGQTGADTWNYDSAEVVFGHYDVRSGDNGGILVGSTHDYMLRGAEPDYGIRITALQDAAGNQARTSTWIGWSIDQDKTDATALEKTATGWKFLTLVALTDIQNDTEGDVYLPVPGPTEIQYLPLILSLNDADGGTRETQIVWSVKPNVTGQWWNQPSQWETVAMAGINTSTAIENGAPQNGYALSQSRPNPATGDVTMAFTMGAAGRATVEVFNTIGQHVATVVDREFAAGEHVVPFDTGRLAAGVYVYRLTAGDYVGTRRMTIVR